MTKPQRLPRLVARVAWAGGLAAALGGLLASSVGGIAASVWVEHGENRELLRVTSKLADELDEELHEEPDDDSEDEQRHFSLVHGARTLQNILAHELEEVSLRRPRAAIRDGHGLFVGDHGLPDVAPGECVRVAEPEPLRVCGAGFEDKRLALAKSIAGERDRRAGFIGAAVLGALAATLFGGLSSWFIASWALGPLDAMRERVRAVRPEAPRPDTLETPTRYLETEELRRAVADLVAQLAAALDRARAFAAQAAHELRTPLAMLEGEVELLCERQPEQVEWRAVQRQLRNLSELVQRLLTLATPGTDLQHSGRAVDLGDVLESVLARLGGDQRRRVDVSMMEDPVVRGDEPLLRTLLDNALSNALKFSTRSRDDRVSVEVFEQGLDWDIVVHVIDYGIGMSDSEREQASIAFYRSPAVRASGVEGHGIGVALMQHVVQAHGGSLRFLPTVRGTVLEIVLPRFGAATTPFGMESTS